VLLTLEGANFPLPIYFSSQILGPKMAWKVNAVVITMVNVAIFTAALATARVVIHTLRSRVVRAPIVVVAGIFSGIELCQFAPFASPLTFPMYVLITGIVVAPIPMGITLWLLGYIVSKRVDSASMTAPQ
jgi:hypothetical protein